MENESPQVPQVDLPVLNFIRQKYVPASRLDATLRMTTMEITEEISQHLGISMDAANIADWLTRQGYSYDTIGDLRFEWLMKETE